MFSIAPSHFVVIAPVVLLIWAVSFARQIVKGAITARAWLILGAALAACYWLFG